MCRVVRKVFLFSVSISFLSNQQGDDVVRRRFGFVYVLVYGFALASMFIIPSLFHSTETQAAPPIQDRKTSADVLVVEPENSLESFSVLSTTLDSRQGAEAAYIPERVAKIGEEISIDSVAAFGERVYTIADNEVTIYERQSSNHLEALGTLETTDEILSVAVDPGYLYLLLGSGDLLIADISDGAAPSIISTTRIPGAQNLTHLSDYIYVTDSQSLFVVTVTDRTQPELTRFTNLNLFGVHQLSIEDNRLYAAMFGKVSVFDLGQPNLPEHLADIATGQSDQVSVRNQTLFVMDSLGRTTVFNVADPETPQKLAEFRPNAQTTDVLSVTDTRVYITQWDRLWIYDVTDPSNPSLVDQFILGGQIRRIQIEGDWLYIASNFGLRIFRLNSGPEIVEVSPPLVIPQNPYAGLMTLNGDYIYTSQGYELVISSIADSPAPQIVNRVSANERIRGLYSVGDRLIAKADDDRKLLFYDLADPQVPNLVSEYTGDDWIVDFDMVGSTLYIAEDIGNSFVGITILDIANPSQPTVLGQLLMPSSPPYQVARGIAVEDTRAYLYVLQTDPNKGFIVTLDVANPAQPVELGRFDPTPGVFAQTFLDFEVQDGLLFYRMTTAQGTSGIRIMDMASASNPQEAALILSPTGVLGNVSGNTLYINSLEGVFVVDIENPESPQLFAFVPEVGTVFTQHLPYLYVQTSYGLAVYWFTRPIEHPLTGVTSTLRHENVEYQFPADATPGIVTVTHTVHAPGLVTGAEIAMQVGPVFSLAATDSITQTQVPFNIQVSYDDTGLDIGDEKALALFAEIDGHWVRVASSQIDTDANIVSAQTNQLSRWTILVPREMAFESFLPLLIAPLADLSVEAIEVTQAVQTLDNQVPLIAERPTVARVHVATTFATALENVVVTLEGERSGNALPGSPLRLDGWTLFPDPKRESYAHSFNFFLPQEWQHGDVSLRATVDATNAVYELDEQNNTLTIDTQFQTTPPLRVVIVPVNYTMLPSGLRFPAPTQDVFTDWVFRSYPIPYIEVEWHTPIDLAHPYGSNGSEMLAVLHDQMRTLKASEGAPASTIYYGVVSMTDENGVTYIASGFIGLGGNGVAVGFDTSRSPGSSFDSAGVLAAHEFGHVFGQDHTFSNPEYPYPADSVGQVGMDITRSRLWRPSAPEFAKDFMSYSGPEWVSDYTYRRLHERHLQNYSQQAARTMTQNAVLVRIQWPENATPSIHPLYYATAEVGIVDADSDYAVEFVDEAGSTVAHYPVSLEEVHGRDFHLQSFVEWLPAPHTPFASVRFVHKQEVLAERSIQNATSQQTLNLTVEEIGDHVEVQWNPNEQPVLIRLNRGGRWITLGVDVEDGVLRLPMETLPGGNQTIEVLIADTPFTSRVRSGNSLRLDDRAPRAWINGPASVHVGQPIILSGHGTDLEDGVLNDFTWRVNDQIVSHAPVLQLASLPAGEYSIFLEVQDSVGQQTQALHQLMVEPEDIAR